MIAGDRRQSGRRARRGGRRAGFVLLDTLAAFAVLAMGLGTILVGLAIAMRSDARELATRGALRIAQSRLAEAGRSYDLAPGRIEGEEPGGERWSVDVEPIGPVDARTAPEQQNTSAKRGAPDRPRPYWVSVVVRYSEGGELHLAALKLDTRRGQ